MKKLKAWYAGVAVLFLSACLFLLLANFLFSGLISFRRLVRPDPGPIWKYGWAPVLLAYPGWSQKEIVTLLDEIYYERAIEYEAFTQFRERPIQGKYVAIHPAGFRIVKNQGTWPPDSAYTNIFVFGGSTTFGYGVANDETIPSYLQELASAGQPRKPVKVYNFGRGYYFSSQETALFHQLLLAGAVPDVVVFIDGLNDLYYLNGKPEYTLPLKNMMDGAQLAAWFARTPINRAAGFVRQRLLKPSGPAEVRQSVIVDDHGLSDVIQRWRRNKKLTEAIAGAFGIHPIFVWQPAPTYQYDIRYHAFCDGDFRRFGAHAPSRIGYGEMDKLRQTGELGDNFLWLGDIQDKRTENLYVDLLHYKPSFAKEIASRIYEFIRQQGLVDVDDGIGQVKVKKGLRHEQF